MFTGIIEELGTVVAIDPLGDSARLSIRGATVTSDAAHGDSISVNGVCLTVVDNAGGVFTADVMGESLDRSTLGSLAAGSPVNLERAATMATRLGGHVVQGHVDGVGTVLSRESGDQWETVTFSLPPQLARYVVEKGSITVDGISLTVMAITDDTFSVGLIPTTLKLTTLGARGVGEKVNLEVDIMAKYVEKLLGAKA
ncbi:riboflavin synthase [Dactylosporangium sp. NPDC005555]|uniref:riboflavin synthase n=1 Tax=Dactylosporangium sp. NPDC005555 TaxID=3154889 RepID=UPI0033B69F4B